MKIFTFSQIGKRANNEDNLGWNERLLMVCDGVGGHVSGEIASRFVVDNMLELFGSDVPNLNKIIIQDKLNEVQERLNSILDKDPQYAKMGSTFTGVFKTATKWYLAHIGDSRIYLFRPSESKLWFSRDHSLVGELMAHHEITREEGRFHPLSNRISKAIIANFDKSVQTASITAIDEIKVGDILLLCSDGVVEAWGDHELVDLFSDDSLSFEQKCEKLKAQCQQLSKDNNTALVAEMDANDAFSFGTNEEVQWVSFQEIKDDYAAYLAKQEPAPEETETAPLIPEDAILSNEVPKADVQVLDVSDEVTLTSDASAKADVMQPAEKPMPNTPPLPNHSKRFFLVIAVLVLIIGVLLVTLLRKPNSPQSPKYKTEQSINSHKKNKPSKNKPSKKTISHRSTKSSNNQNSQSRKSDTSSGNNNGRMNDTLQKGKDKSGKDTKKETEEAGNSKPSDVRHLFDKNKQPDEQVGDKPQQKGSDVTK